MTTILAVDDSISILRLIEIALSSDECEVIKAEGPKEALEEINKRVFDLIISDLHMPDMTGLELIKKIRQVKEYEDVPIIMLTTETSVKIANEGRSLGVSVWATKPFKPDVMRSVVDKVLSRRK